MKALFCIWVVRLYIEKGNLCVCRICLADRTSIVLEQTCCTWRNLSLAAQKVEDLASGKHWLQACFHVQRRINDNYNECSEFHRYDTPKCKCCFNSFKKVESWSQEADVKNDCLSVTSFLFGSRSPRNEPGRLFFSGMLRHRLHSGSSLNLHMSGIDTLLFFD